MGNSDETRLVPGAPYTLFFCNRKTTSDLKERHPLLVSMN